MAKCLSLKAAPKQRGMDPAEASYCFFHSDLIWSYVPELASELAFKAGSWTAAGSGAHDPNPLHPAMELIWQQIAFSFY